MVEREQAVLAREDAAMGTADALQMAETAVRGERRAAERAARAVTRLNDVASGTIPVLVAMVDLRDRYTAQHSAGVGRLCCLLAEELGWAPEDVALAHMTGLVHDIGKVGLPDDVLRKPERPTPEEWDLIRRHPDWGADALAEMHLMPAAVDGVRAHHERWDGSGYPDGLRGHDIPSLGRLVALCDSYDAMTGRRPFRRRKAARPGPRRAGRGGRGALRPGDDRRAPARARRPGRRRGDPGAPRLRRRVAARLRRHRHGAPLHAAVRRPRGRHPRVVPKIGSMADPLVIEARPPTLRGRASRWLRGRRLLLAGFVALVEVVLFIVWRPSAVLLALLAVALLVVSVAVATRLPMGLLRDVLWIVAIAQGIVVLIPLVVGLSVLAGLLVALVLIVGLILVAARWRV